MSTPRTPGQERLALKKLVRVFYDIQRLRLQTGGRTHERPEGSEIHLHEEDVKLLEGRMKELERFEKLLLKDVASQLKTIGFYKNVLSDKVRFRGIGPTMAGVILSEFDIHREDTVSKMWAFAGLRPMPADRCKICNEVVTKSELETFSHAKSSKCRLAKVVLMTLDVYASGKAQKPTKGEKLNYNAWLRTKLVGVLGGVMLKVGSPYRKFYDDYKHRKQSAGWGVSDGHRHNAAIRYMIKMLLLDIWRDWRTFENLPVRPSYAEEYLGKVHSGQSPRDTQHANASQMNRDNHPQDASRSARDTQPPSASRPNRGTQNGDASRTPKATRARSASQSENVTQKARASRGLKVTQKKSAGRTESDNLSRGASQPRSENQIAGASQAASDTHASDATFDAEIDAEIANAE